MLDRQQRLGAVRVAPEPMPEPKEIGLADLFAFAKRRRLAIGLSVLVAVVLGGVWTAASPPVYSASTSLLIDTRKIDIFSDGDVYQDASITNAAVETQVEILRSGLIAGRVVDELGLVSDPVFMADPGSPLDQLQDQVASLAAHALRADAATPPTEQGLRNSAINKLRKNLKVGRTGLSYVIGVSFSSADAALSARIVNAVTNAYLEDQVGAQVSTAQRATNWLSGRIEELRAQVNDPTLTIEEKSAIRATYDTFLQRYTETVQQQNLPLTEARVITYATNGSKTAPDSAMIMAAAIIFGGVVGLGLGVTRDFLDKAVRTGTRVQEVTHAPFLGYLPRFDVRGRAMRRFARDARKSGDAVAQRFAAGPAYSLVLNTPFSRFAETIRSIRVAASRLAADPMVVLGVVSPMPGEGRTTVAINLARLAAQSGARTLLIDGDLRNSTLSKNLVPTARAGLINLVARSVAPEQAIWTDAATPLRFIPAGTSTQAGSASEVLSSDGMRGLLDACRQHYDLIVVDLPPLLPVVDVRAAAHLFDAFAMVAEWGGTSEDALAQAFQVAGVGEKVIGTVLNKVNLSTQKRYASHELEMISDNRLSSHRQVA